MSLLVHTPRDDSPAASRLVLGMRVDSVTPAQALAKVEEWAGQARPRIVCAANVHMVMEAFDHPLFRAQVNGADLVLPDGVPTVWALRALGLPCPRRVRVTPDWLRDLFAMLERRGFVLSLYGGAQATLDTFAAQLATHYPLLRIGAVIAPPFRPMTADEDADAVRRIVTAETDVLFTGIGCPKQERWMADHRDSLECVMIGVGAAFDVFGGRTRQAPAWMRERGLEWTYRLLCEPRRLWRRYLVQNPRFVLLFAAQCLRAPCEVARTSLKSPTSRSTLCRLLGFVPRTPLGDEDHCAGSQAYSQGDAGVAHQHAHGPEGAAQHKR